MAQSTLAKAPGATPANATSASEEETEDAGVGLHDDLDQVLARHPHLARYLQARRAEGHPDPTWVPTVSRDLKEAKKLDFLYPVGDPVFVHVIDDGGHFPRYVALEPELDPVTLEAYTAVRDRAFLRSDMTEPPTTLEQRARLLDRLVDRCTKVVKQVPKVRLPGGRRANTKPVPVTQVELATIRYHLQRDVLSQNRMEPLMRDPYIEDIHGLGLRPIHCVHKVFGMLETSIRFPDFASLDAHLVDMSNRMGRLVSDSNPIVDGALPDGSRINIVYSDAISRGGSSFTVRKFSETPFPVSQLVAWKTFSPQVAAYLWLCLETGMSVFVSGETASGKTTTLNGILPFIRPQSKILTAEDTPEVLPPHRNWQQLVTRETGPVEARVHTYDLLKSALRSRPDYIIVGEIRGAEGAVAFQAMQTGHATMATFHASSVAKLIQRFTSAPISVPAQFMDNLQVALIQMAVYVGGRMLRRVLAVEEIEGFDRETGGVATRQVFTWDPVNDRHVFAGRNNSFVLETMVADRLGLDDPRQVYVELDRRARIIEALIKHEKFDYHEVQHMLFSYATEGAKALPFRVEEI